MSDQDKVRSVFLNPDELPYNFIVKYNATWDKLCEGCGERLKYYGHTAVSGHKPDCPHK